MAEPQNSEVDEKFDLYLLYLPPLPSRKPLHLPATPHTQRRNCILGDIVNDEMILSEFGDIVNNEWLKSFDIRRE